MTTTARWTCMQIEALMGSVVRELTRLDAALDGAPAPAVEGARLALDDARRLLERAHYVRRLVEQLGPDVPPEDAA
jgi:hypothetical protein